MLRVMYRNARQAQLPIILGTMARRALSDCERGLGVKAYLTGASVMKTAQRSDVTQGTVSKVILAWECEGKTSPRDNSPCNHAFV